MKASAAPAIEHQPSSQALHAGKQGNTPFFGPAAENEAPFFAPRIQTKLSIGQPGDKYEQEADAVADRVVQRLANPGAPIAVQKKCQDCEEKEKLQRKEEEREEPTVMRQVEDEQEETPPVQAKAEKEEEEPKVMRQMEDEQEEAPAVQTKEKDEEEPRVMRQPENEQEETPAVQPKEKEEEEKRGIMRQAGPEEEEPLQAKAEAGASTSPSLQSRLSSAKGAGAPMDKSARAPMEAAFGQDFGQVRIHTDSGATQMNRELNARAFTHGRDIYFNAGKYSPGSTEGRRLLAHELVHVGQQGGKFARSGLQSSTLQLSRLSNELSQLWNSSKGAYFSLLRQRSPVGDKDVLEFIKKTLRGDDLWLASNIAKYGVENKWPIHLKIERELNVWPGSLTQIKTLADAEKVLKFWGITTAKLIGMLPAIQVPLAGVMAGNFQVQSLQQRAQNAFQRLNQKGKKTYKEMLKLVEREPFWKKYLSTRKTSIFIIPDLTGKRYGGLMHRVSVGNGSIFKIHLPKHLFEHGLLQNAAGILIHELSHTYHYLNSETLITSRWVSPLRGTLCELLLTHPEIQSKIKAASDPGQAKKNYLRYVNQILYEQTNYAESEIFVISQQISFSPTSITNIFNYLTQLRKIGLSQTLFIKSIENLENRIRELYSKRILETKPPLRVELERTRNRVIEYIKNWRKLHTT